MTTTKLESSWLCGHCSSAFDLSRMYCCAKCATLVCAHCVSEELVSYYCPQCLSRVTKRQAFEYENRCHRCVQCADCAAPLQTVERAAAQFALQCPHCQWTSDERARAPRTAASLEALLLDVRQCDVISSVPWARHVADALVALRADDAAQQKALAAARRRSTYTRGASVAARRAPRRTPFTLDARLRADTTSATIGMSPASSTPPSSTPSSSSTTTTSSSSSSLSSKTNDRFVIDVDQTSSIEQRVRDVEQAQQRDRLRPRRMLLETRALKRCAACHSLLVKPDVAPDKATFSEINASALMVLPWMIAHRDNGSGQTVLSFDNATTTATRVIVARSDAALDAADALVAQLAPFDDAAGRRAQLTLPADSATASMTWHCQFGSATPPLRCRFRLK